MQSERVAKEQVLHMKTRCIDSIQAKKHGTISLNDGLEGCTQNTEVVQHSTPVVHNPVGCTYTCAHERFVGFRPSLVLRVLLASLPSWAILL